MSMDSSTARWFTDAGMIDDPSFHQWELGSLEQFPECDPDIWEDVHHSFSTSDSYNNHNTSAASFGGNPNSASNITSNTFSGGSSIDSSGRPAPPPPANQRPKKVPRTSAAALTTPSILTFGSPDSPMPIDHPEFYNSLVAGGIVPKEELGGVHSFGAGGGPVKRNNDALTKGSVGVKRTTTGGTARPPSQNQDHIIAERKRREKLSQRFIALSAIVPGLKKMDKASVLGDAIKYLKQLQERVKALEEQSAQKPVESVVLVKKTQASSDDDGSSCDENFEKPPSSEEDQSVPEIEVKLSEKTVLVKIHCKNHKGVLVKALAEIDSLNLSVTSTSSIPFAASALDITVTAQIEEGFAMTVKELVKKLNTAFKQFM